MDKVLQAVTSSKSVEWYTPYQYVSAAAWVMGGIDLDPASCKTANWTVEAKSYFDAEQNGLIQSWGTPDSPNRVFLNPPYGKYGRQSSQGVWAAKLISEYEIGHVSQAILLVNWMPGYKWFQPLWRYPFCAVDHCIRFLGPDGQEADKAIQNSAFFYFGQNVDKFQSVFSLFGPVGQVDLRRRPLGKR